MDLGRRLVPAEIRFCGCRGVGVSRDLWGPEAGIIRCRRPYRSPSAWGSDGPGSSPADGVGYQAGPSVVKHVRRRMHLASKEVGRKDNMFQAIRTLKHDLLAVPCRWLRQRRRRLNQAQALAPTPFSANGINGGGPGKDTMTDAQLQPQLLGVPRSHSGDGLVLVAVLLCTLLRGARLYESKVPKMEFI